LPGFAEAREQNGADAVNRCRRIHRLLAAVLHRLPDHAVFAGQGHTGRHDEVAHVAG